MSVENQQESSRLWTLVLSVAAGPLFLAILDAKEHREYRNIVSAFKSFEKQGACDVSIDINRIWSVSWRPYSMEVTMSESEKSITGSTFADTPPDRFQKEWRDYLYRYNVDRRTDEGRVASFLQFRLGPRDNELQWIEMGQCAAVSSIEGVAFVSGDSILRCTEPEITIRCENPD